jgi:hypothetical protein
MGLSAAPEKRLATLPVVLSASTVNEDYDWDPERMDVAAPLREMRISEIREKALAGPSLVHRPTDKDKGSLTNFFEFATKDMPKIPVGSLSNIGVWTNPEPETNGAAAAHDTEDPDEGWGLTPRKPVVIDEESEKKYIHQYKRAMEDKIANVI